MEQPAAGRITAHDKRMVRKIIQVHRSLALFTLTQEAETFALGVNYGLSSMAAITADHFWRDLPAIAERWMRRYCREDH